MLNEHQIKEKWNEIKGGVRNLWGRITDDDLEKTKGNFSELSSIVQTKYGETEEMIKKNLNRLMDSFENETDKNGPSLSAYEKDSSEVLKDSHHKSRAKGSTNTDAAIFNKPRGDVHH